MKGVKGAFVIHWKAHNILLNSFCIVFDCTAVTFIVSASSVCLKLHQCPDIIQLKAVFTFMVRLIIDVFTQQHFGSFVLTLYTVNVAHVIVQQWMLNGEQIDNFNVFKSAILMSWVTGVVEVVEQVFCSDSDITWLHLFTSIWADTQTHVKRSN